MTVTREDMLNTKTEAEMMELATKMAQEKGSRLPTIVEIIAGFSAVFLLYGLSDEEVNGMMGLAGQYTKKAMEKADKTATA